MRHRPTKLGIRSVVVGVVLALAAMVTLPGGAVAAGTLDEVVLQDAAGADYPLGDHPVSAVNTGFAFTLLGTTYPCVGANAAGTFRSTEPYDNPYLIFGSVNIVNCAWPAGMTLNMSLSPGCAMRVDATRGQTVDDLLVDHNVLGSASIVNAGSLHPPCTLKVDGGALCQMTIAGTVAATFDEDKDGAQNLNLGGTGLTIASGTGLCGYLPGASLDFGLDLTVTAGSNPGDRINFRP